jgi:hypothetical protein
MDMIQTNFTPGKIQRVLEGEQPSQQFYNKAFGRYHVAIEDGYLTSTQRQMQLAQMVTLKTQAGIEFSPEDYIEASTLQNKTRILENIEKANQQAQQQAQSQQQSAMQLNEARSEDMKSRAEANRGLAIERASRVDENEALAVERRAAAIKDQDQGILALVKAMREIETTDLGHLQQLLTIQNIMSARQQQQDVMNEGSTEDKKAEAIAAVSSRSRNQQPEQQVGLQA